MSFGVHPSFRRQSLGVRLLCSIKVHMHARNCLFMVLHVAADNRAAITFYTRNGFSQQELLRDYYFWGGEHHDAYMYDMPLARLSVIDRLKAALLACVDPRDITGRE